MPSMHLGAASVYVLAAWKTRWLIPAVAFWLIIFVASAYFGYHYWVDGLAAFVVAWACWRVTVLFFSSRQAGFATPDSGRLVSLVDAS